MAPLFGILLHAIGGLAAGSNYVPFRKICHWSWQTYWLITIVVSYAIMPSVAAWITTPQFLVVLGKTPTSTLALVFCFGVLWGVGNLTFGLTARYLGLSLGYAVALGLCTACGTLVPVIVHGKFVEFITPVSGQIVLAGILVCLAGIAMCGYAGIRKESELSEEQKQAGVKEFSLAKGFVMAVVAGLMSSFMAFAVDAGKPIGEIAVECGIPEVYRNTPLLVLVMGGCAAANVIWCLLLGVTSGSLRDYAAGPVGQLAGNYSFAILAGVIGYNEFFWYGMGTTKMGRYDFSSWSIHLAFVIIFSSIWGLFFREWKDIGRGTRWILWGGLATLLLSTAIIGGGNCMATLYPSESIAQTSPSHITNTLEK